MSEKQELIGSLSEELILRLASQLVSIPTRNPPGEEKEGASFIFETFRSWGIEAELILAPDPQRPQVVAWARGGGQGPTLILNGHIDTVREGDVSDWSFPPFKATRQGNRLYGLGACDMKGSLAVGMAVLKAIAACGLSFPGTVLFQAVMGEELAEDGTRTLLRLGYTGDYAIVLEPTALQICRATRGVAWYKVTLAGNPIHCGRAAPETPDLVTQFARVASALADYHQEIARKEHPLVPSPACRVTQLRAGERHNHLPACCEFTIDRRMLPGETFDQVQEELLGILEDVRAGDPSFDYRLTYDRGNEPVVTPEDSLLIKTLRRNSEELLGATPNLIGSAAGTDMRNFVFDAGIPAVNFGPGNFVTCNCHGPDEFVPVDELMACGRVVLGTAYDLLMLERG
ncbi:MAG: M20 family metallopeptidase [Anaerolineae bacterium]